MVNTRRSHYRTLDQDYLHKGLQASRTFHNRDNAARTLQRFARNRQRPQLDQTDLDDFFGPEDDDDTNLPDLSDLHPDPRHWIPRYGPNDHSKRHRLHDSKPKAVTVTTHTRRKPKN